MSSRVGQFGQISEINNHLCLSGSGVLKADTIKSKKITCIVNATTEQPTSYLEGVDYVKVRVDDNPAAHLDTYFDMVADKIKSVRDQGGRTLVHCVAGVSRSASLCMVYLVKHEKMTLRQAYFHVKSIRTIIHPNPGFWKQMIDYERRLTGRNSVRLKQEDSVDMPVPDIYPSHGHPRRIVSNPSASHHHYQQYQHHPSSWLTSSPPINKANGGDRSLGRRGWSSSMTSGGRATRSSSLVTAPSSRKTESNLFSSLYHTHNHIFFPHF